MSMAVFALACTVCGIPAALGLSLRCLQRGAEFFDAESLFSWEVAWSFQMASVGLLGGVGVLLLAVPARVAWLLRVWWCSSVALALYWTIVNAAWLGWAADRAFARSEVEVGDLGVFMVVTLSASPGLLGIFAPILGEWWRAVILAEIRE